METITLGGVPAHTNGFLPKTGSKAPDCMLTTTGLNAVQLKTFFGTKLLLNIFPSMETQVCARSVRKFNEVAAGVPNTKVLCISRDLPFAQHRFCSAEGLDNVTPLSDFKSGEFSKKYGVEIQNGAFAGLAARAVIILDKKGIVRYTELVAEIDDEPDYAAAIDALNKI